MTPMTAPEPLLTAADERQIASGLTEGRAIFTEDRD
jgi:hypothetical protein